MFPVKHTVIYTFFAITSVQNTCFCSVFNALASKNPAKSCYVQCFFHFWPFFHCRKATKMTQNSISIPSCAQTPKNPRKMSKTPPYSGLGAKPFLAPPAKADIATAILTNVIEHLVLLFPPNKHAFTAKAAWADFFVLVYTHSRSKYTIVLVRLRQNFSNASRAALYEKLRTCKAMLRRERQEKVEMKDDSQGKSMHFSHVGSYFIGTGECATHDANVH